VPAGAAVELIVGRRRAVALEIDQASNSRLSGSAGRNKVIETA
jgi:hypothetical protein